MSIQSEINRISGNVSDALDAIEDKGVTIPSGANSDDLADLISQIESGGGGVGGITQDQDGYLVLDDEAPGGGGGGADCPTFTLTWDEYWEEILTVTCDKTFAECLDYFEDDPVKLVAHLEQTDELQSESAVFGMSGELNAYGTEITYHAIGSMGEAAFDITIASNGTITWAEPTPTPSGGLEYEEGTWTPASDTSSYPATRISFSNSHTTAPFLAVIEDVTDTLATADSMLWWTETNIGNLYGAVATTSSALLYGRRQYAYKTSSSYSAGGANLASQADIDLDTTGFDLTFGSASYYWRAGRTYKWIAVWAPTT